MPPGKKILIADPDLEATRALGPLLRARGFQVHTARNGSRALELAVLRFPDLVLFDEGCSLVDAPTFLQILRTNPRTETIPVLLTGRADPLEPLGGAGLQLRKPYNADEVLARIEQILRRLDAEREVASDKEIQGQLSHLSLADLLQVFAMNRKSGTLQLRFDGLDAAREQAELVIVEGRIHDARGPRVSGEKALFRYLPRRQGSFEFRPGRSEVPDRIRRGVDDVLLDGLRQSDELAEIVPKLPPPDCNLELSLEQEGITAGAAVARQIVAALRAGPLPVSELIDRCDATDFEASRTLLSLLEKGHVRRVEKARGPRALLELGEVHLLRQRLLRHKAPQGGVAVGKVLIGGDGEALAAAVQRLETLPGYAAEADFDPTEGAPGRFGRIELGAEVRIELVAIPCADEWRPVWRPLSTDALGGLVVDGGAGGLAFAGWIAEDLGLPATRLPADPGLTVRELLAAVAKR